MTFSLSTLHINFFPTDSRLKFGVERVRDPDCITLRHNWLPAGNTTDCSNNEERKRKNEDGCGKTVESQHEKHEIMSNAHSVGLNQPTNLRQYI